MTGLQPGCFCCDQQAGGPLPPREDVLTRGGWRVAHAFGATLPGWLVLVPTRHVTTLAQLDDDEAAQLGLLAVRASRALEAVTGCVKTYAMQFSEAEGFEHLHVHLVPRAADHPLETRGPRVFAHLSDDPDDWLPEAERDALALALRAALEGSAPAVGDGVVAPFHGVATVLVREGQEVAAGETVARIEAMKMEAAVTAPRAGRVRRLEVRGTRSVDGGELLLTLA